MTGGMPTEERGPLKLRFLGSLIEQLGAQLYPGATATMAELISNAWDADAHHVWIEIPLGRPWTKDEEIVVTDDGIGMSYEDAETRYLLVGRKRRVALDQDRTDGGRLLHGRKGIGKLAAFGTAKVLECLTTDADGQVTSFRLDYDHIRDLDPTDDYEVERARGDNVLHDPEGNALDHGTRITLSVLRPRRAMNEAQFRRSLARRFALDANEMRIVVNGEEIGRFDYDLDLQFPNDGRLFDTGVIDAPDGWAEMEMDSGPVRWWIGFTEKPLREKQLQGVSVLARGKMVQRPFFFQRTAGAEGQLGQEYLIGEVQADWLDEGHDIDTDLIQANRDQLQLEDERLNDFMEWGQDLIRRALKEWSSLRQARVEKGLALSNFTDLMAQLTPDERQRMVRVTRGGGEDPCHRCRRSTCPREFDRRCPRGHHRQRTSREHRQQRPRISNADLGGRSTLWSDRRAPQPNDHRGSAEDDCRIAKVRRRRGHGGSHNPQSHQEAPVAAGPTVVLVG